VLHRSWRRGLFVGRNAGAPKPPIFRDSVAHLIKSKQLFYVYMNYAARFGPLVPANRNRRLQVFETSKANGPEGSPHGGERSRQQPVVASEAVALMMELTVLLQFAGIERPPLGAAPVA